MEAFEIIILALLVVLILFVAYRAMGKKGAGPSDGKWWEAAAEGGAPWDLGSQRQASMNAVDREVSRRAASTAWNSPYASSAGKGYRSRNGHYIDPSRLSEAEQQAWAPSNPYAAPNYDPKRDVSPGDSLSQSLGRVQEGDWSQRLADFAVDAQTIANHRDWADNVGPFSQTAMAVDDLDEQVALGAQPRTGITAFRPLTVPQGPCTLQITEVGPADHAEHMRRFDF